ncbi:hypothetical protein [Mucilaginibacter pedocola]|uniref:Uncharacterized protein n=1 Tax=Mucilaginibacter pedocola TaxID=1792845 RepID=A0A1S9PG92_9SPHI|nr:hypothetical protein [Mucilaginibacter pedocola]OOQ59959.1 hypothetical protein BC343_27800 [Mucilaginibacter pedocola]
MSTLNETVPQMQFLDDRIPQLAAGTYQIEVEHNILDVSHDIKGNYALGQQFIVQGPRFALPPNSVQAQFPTPGSGTDFHASLPFVVLRNEFLPWSRKIGGIPADTPWMALMVFRVNEIAYTKPANADASPTLSTIRPVKTEVVKYNANNTIGPDIELDAIEQSLLSLQANTIDVTYGTFKQLAPKAAELPFLAHVRSTDNGANAPDGETNMRSYATILANRLANPATEELYIAHLVSLEGWANYLPGGTPPQPVADTTKLRLVSLLSWKFNNKKAGVNFGQLINTMSVDTLKMPFNPPAAWGADESKYTPAQKETTKKYKEGYVALNYDARTGEKSFAWYRGPFVPVVPSVISRLVPKEEDGLYKTYISTADKAMIYDADTGIFNHSYAVAWELGRMLTLGNRPAAIAIWQWKKASLQKLQTLWRILADRQKKIHYLQSTEVKLGLTALLDGLDWRQVSDDLMDNQAGKYIFMEYLGNELGKHILGIEKEPVISVLDPTGLQEHLDDLPGVLSNAEILEALQNGVDPHVLIANKLDEALKLYADKQ